MTPPPLLGDVPTIKKVRRRLDERYGRESWRDRSSLPVAKTEVVG